jgi:DNA repair protein RadA/Sms
VGGVGRRLAEAGRLGFTAALVPAGTHDVAPETMGVHEVAVLATALRRTFEGLGPPDGIGPPGGLRLV